MNGEGGTSIEDIVRRNIAALRAKASLTQQALADEMLLRGVAWTRETVAQVETTNRRIGLTEAIAVAACLDVPLARLTATGADTVSVGASQWTAPYLSAAIAGTAGDVFAPESYAAPTRVRHEEPHDALGRGGGAAAPADRRPVPRRWSSSADAARATVVPSRWSRPSPVEHPDGHRVRRAPPDGRTDRTPPAAAGDRRRRRQHRPAPVVAEPRGRA